MWEREEPSDAEAGRRDRNDVACDRHGRGLAGRPWSERRPALRSLFEEISPRYDHLNRLLSLGLDRRWRRWAVQRLRGAPPGPWCDLASGTGDLAMEMARAGRVVVRADLSPALLRLASRKIRWARPGIADSTGEPNGPEGAGPVVCEMDALPFRDGAFSAVGQGFALRHCRAFETFFAELHRVLRPGGWIAILDMREPFDGLVAPAYRFYFRRLLPRLAALLGGERGAYEMMVASVRALPPEEELLHAARQAGFERVASQRGLFGSVRLILGRKPDGNTA